jgi:hypothetical protein
MDSLRKFKDVKIGEDCSNLSGHHENELLHGCQFRKLNGLTLKDCVLDRSRFNTESVADALGFTLTLDCHSFRDVEYSPLLFDLLLVMMITTKGNEEKRIKLIEVVGKKRYEALLRVLQRTE